MARAYYDGDLCVLVEPGMPHESVLIGVGGGWDEARDSLAPTAIQSIGADSGISAALRWAYGAGWISAPETLQEVAGE